jgi:hypothetical protein
MRFSMVSGRIFTVAPVLDESMHRFFETDRSPDQAGDDGAQFGRAPAALLQG